MLKYAFYPTDNRLSEYIFSYGTIDGYATEPYSLLSPPNGLTGFLIRTGKHNFDVIAENFQGNPIAHQPSYVIGQITYPITGYTLGPVKFLVIFFQPLGMYQLFGRKMSELKDKSEDFFNFLGQDVAENLVETLKTTDNIERQMTVLNQFFLKLTPVKDDCDDLKKVLQLIHVSQGNISVNELEGKSKINRRTLQRNFQDKIGLTPKEYAQVYRFKCAINYLEQNTGLTWTDLSNKTEFFDQSHMIRYFKKYTNVSPTKLVKLDIELINFLLKY